MSEHRGLAKVGLSGSSLELACSHAQEAQIVLEMLQQTFPVKVRVTVAYEGDQVMWLIEKCDSLQSYILWWLMRELCARGWEAFSSYTDPAEGIRYLFRLDTKRP
jgi:hypothetical protein